MEKSAREGLIDKSGNLIQPENSSLANKSSTRGDKDAVDNKEPEYQPENLWAKRTRVLGKSVGVSAKLGELYADEHVLQGDSAGVYLIWAVETILKELRRREVEGVKEGEGDWMTPEQIGGAFEGMCYDNIANWARDMLCDGLLTQTPSPRESL